MTQTITRDLESLSDIRGTLEPLEIHDFIDIHDIKNRLISLVSIDFVEISISWSLSVSAG